MSDKRLKVVDPNVTWDDKLRLWLEAYIRQFPHHTAAVLSRAEYIGVSKTALDAYLKGTYFLAVEKGGQGIDPRRSNCEDRIRKFRERVEGNPRDGGRRFIETETWYNLVMACETAINENAIVVAHAKPGTGKSRCLAEFARRKMTTAPITVLCSANITTRYFGQKIARALELSDHPPTARLEEMIAEKLRRSPRPIFVDQANYLNEKGLGTICHLWEIARVPIVLVGTKNLYDLFITSRLTEEVREQLSRRVTMFYGLPGLSANEGQRLIKAALGEHATDAVCAQIMNRTGGVYDHLDKVLRRVPQLEKSHGSRLSIDEIVSIACAKLWVA